MTAATAILAGLALQVAQGAGPGSVRGVVRDAAEGRPLVGAVVTLVSDGRSVVTDSTGAYHFPSLSPGERRLRASRLDFSALEVRLLVPDGGAVQVDFHLTLRPVAMPVVEAIAASGWVSDSLASDPGTVPVGTAVVRLLDATPGVAESGIASAARQFLGPDPPVPDDVLFVRGAGAALDLVLLDGAPVQAPFHLGGLIQPGVAPSVVSADRLQGGVSPRWDGGLSDVLLLESRPGFGRPARSALYADMLSAGGVVEGGSPGRTAWLVSLRGLHGAAVGPFVEGAFPEAYADGLGRLDIATGWGDTVAISGFWNRETVYLDPEDPEPDPPEWGNRAGAIRYRGSTPLGRTELGAGYGEFRTRLPIGRTVTLTADGLSRRTRLTADVETRLGPGRLGYGAHVDRLDLRTRFRTDLADTAAVREFRQRSDATALSAWLALSWPVTRALRLSAGLRATKFSADLGDGLSPRLRADLLLADDLVLSVSGGRYQQLLVTADPDGVAGVSFITSSDGAPLSLAFTEIVRGTADHLVLSLARATATGSEIRLEGHWKRATGLPDLPGADLRNAGLDLWLRQTMGAFELWGTYSLGWGWSGVASGPDVELFSGRHFLRGGLTRDFADEGLRLDADLSYGAGLEYGSIPRADRPLPLAGSRPAGSGDAPVADQPSFSIPGTGPNPALAPAPDGSYLRLNVQATGRVRVRMFGREQILFPYFRIVNALDRNDALFYRFDGAEDGAPRAIGAVPILPVLGLEWHL
ncbi:MAG: TonB-dependent receptor [Gemmatimonadota bacterium]